MVASKQREELGCIRQVAVEARDARLGSVGVVPQPQLLSGGSDPGGLGRFEKIQKLADLIQGKVERLHRLDHMDAVRRPT